VARTVDLRAPDGQVALNYHQLHKKDRRYTLRRLLTETHCALFDRQDEKLLDVPLSEIELGTFHPMRGNSGGDGRGTTKGSPSAPERPSRAPAPAPEQPRTAAEQAAKDLLSVLDAPAEGPEQAPAAPAATVRTGPKAGYPKHPQDLTDEMAVRIAYHQEIEQLGKYLNKRLSVMVVCQKLLGSHLAREIVTESGLKPRFPEQEESDTAESTPGQTPETGGSDPMSRRDLSAIMGQAMGGASRSVQRMREILANQKRNEVLVLRNLDVLTCTPGGGLAGEARELVELLYQYPAAVLIGLADPTLEIPAVISSRFAIRAEVSGLPRYIGGVEGARDRPRTLDYLITRPELDKLSEYDPDILYKNVSGFHAIQFRNAMRYLAATCPDGEQYDNQRCLSELRNFKTGSGEEIEVPDTTLEDIGGYDDVKREIQNVIKLMDSATVESLGGAQAARMLMPRGIIFHGPPGTGKTMFSKAIANRLNATIQIIPGPSVMSKYVGEAEANIRRIFSTARRNAPSVIVFDEFDSIAMRRSGGEDGGARANAAVVAQLLTEIDGFREDQQILVVGTTNRLDVIDEAFLRPSRFTPIEIGLPDEEARLRIAQIHAHRFNMGTRGEPNPDDQWDIEIPAELFRLIAKYTKNFNGDEVASLFQRARRERITRGVEVDARLFGLLIGEKRREKTEVDQKRASSRPAH